MAVNGFNKYAAGTKTYGGGRPMPTVGPVDPMGYKIRDAKYATRQKETGQHLAAIKRRVQAGQKKQHFSSDWLSYPFGKMG